MRANRRRDTGPELRLRSALHRMGFRYRVDVAPLPGSRCRADIVFPRAMVAVFVDGCFWHGCYEHCGWPKTNGRWWHDKIRQNQIRDAKTDQALMAAGWLSIRVWEHEDSAESALRVARAVEERHLMGAGVHHPR
jgi:DNA mismatch endonuclease, patch repair protein